MALEFKLTFILFSNLFVLRMKLDMGNGTMAGEVSTCKKNGQHCPEFRMFYYDVDKDREYTIEKARLHPHAATRYGEYFDFTATVSFTDEDLNPENGYYTMYLRGPGKLIMLELIFFSRSYFP